MANEHFNGIGQMFRIWEYPEREHPELVPLVIALHGGGGWFGNFKPMHDGVYKSYMAQAMFFCPDDGLDVKRSDRVRIQKSYWLGFWEDYNRFLLPEEQPVPDTGLILLMNTLQSPGKAETTVSDGQTIMGGVASSSRTLKLQTAESPARFLAVSVMI